MKKNIKFLLPMLAVALLLGVSSVSCASNVKGKTFKCEGEYVTISFITKLDYVYKVGGVEDFKGEYKVAKKVITCKYPGGLREFKYTIINKKEIKDSDGRIWKKI